MERRIRLTAALGLLVAVTVSLVDARAAEPQRLTFDGRIKTDPVFIDQGRQLLFTMQETSNQLSLMRLTLEDGNVERFRPGATTSEFSVTFSADERYYAYVQNDGNLHVKLVVHDAEQAVDLAAYNPGGGFAGIRNVSMAPDGSGVAFAFPERGFAQQIFWLSRDGQTRRVLTDSDGFDACPRYAPDGRHLAFASTRSGNFDICLLTVGTGRVNQLTDRVGLDTRPAWSPDGRRIAYTSLRDGNYDICVINADGSGDTRVTTHAERDDFACWHPDGKRLAVVSQRDGHEDLYLFEVGP